MDTQTLLPIAIVVVLVLGAGIIAWLSMRGNRSQKLRDKFGPEYDYTIEQVGDRHAAEHSLRDREKRVSKFSIRDLETSEADLYRSKWVEIQANFVDNPVDAVEQANLLIKEVMEARGFPTSDFEERAADLSVIYPMFVSNYRNAHAIAEKSRSDGAATEDLRQAMVYYRSLFEELLGKETTQETEVKVS